MESSIAVANGKKADCRLLAMEKAKRESGGKGKGNTTNAIT